MNKETKFRLRLNLFDSIILLLILLAGAFTLWNFIQKKQNAHVVPTEAQTIEYTIRFKGSLPETIDMISVGDKLTDSVKNFAIGTVVSATQMPATMYVLDEENQIMKDAPLPDRIDIDIVVSCQVTVSDSQLLLDGGFVLRANEEIYVRGPGYFGVGFVTTIDREVQK